MPSRSTTSLRPRCAARSTAQLPGDPDMSVTVQFCGAAHTVTGSCYLVETPIRALPDRLRPVPGAKDPEGAQLWRLSVPARRCRCRGSDACPYRPQRAIAEAGARAAFAAGSWRRAAPSICAPTCCRMPAAFRNPRSRRSTGATRRAADPRSPRSTPRPMRLHRCSRSSRSSTRPGST